MNHFSIPPVVPESFFITPHPHCKNHDGTWRHERGEHAVGCHCIEDYSDCRKIVQFLTLDGKLSIKKNINILFSEVVVSFPKAVATNFSTMITDMMYPIFERRFSQKHEFLRKKNSEDALKADNIKTEVDCLAYGTDCVVALDRLNDTIQKLYRVFSVLNKDSSELLKPASSIDMSPYLGTLLANLNFQVDDDQSGVASFELKQDMKKLLASIIPSSEMSLTDMISFLGYSDISGDSSRTKVKSKNSILNSTTDCPTRQNSTNEYSTISRSSQLKRIEKTTQIQNGCNFNKYMQRWISYMQYLNRRSTNASSSCNPGNILGYDLLS